VSRNGKGRRVFRLSDEIRSLNPAADSLETEERKPSRKKPDLPKEFKRGKKRSDGRTMGPWEMPRQPQAGLIKEGDLARFDQKDVWLMGLRSEGWPIPLG